MLPEGKIQFKVEELILVKQRCTGCELRKVLVHMPAVIFCHATKARGCIRQRAAALGHMLGGGALGGAELECTLTTQQPCCRHSPKYLSSGAAIDGGALGHQLKSGGVLH